MVEKRQAIRYRLGEGTDIVIFREGGNLVTPLLDLSRGGLMISISESESRQLLLGQEIRGQLRRRDHIVPWQGRIVHRSFAQGSRGIGIAFTGMHDDGLSGVVGDIVQHPDAGGLHLRRSDRGSILEVHGRLSFLTSRDALAYIRRGDIRFIDLTHCSMADSAGLGMLCLAKDRQVTIVGAHGAIAKLLAIARIIEPEMAGGSAGTDFPGQLH